MDDIIRIRGRIDELDEEIVRLLKNRYENTRSLGRIKQKRGLDYRDPEREKVILRKMERTATSLDIDSKFIGSIFEQIFALSVEAQQNHPEKPGKKLDRTRILIVGGTGGMGRFFARFASLQGAKVRLAGREINKTRTAAKEIEVEPGTILDAASSDMTGISDRIAEKIPKGLEYVSLHPLFGPSIDHLHDQTIIAVSYNAGQKWSKLASALHGGGEKDKKM